MQCRRPGRPSHLRLSQSLIVVDLLRRQLGRHHQSSKLLPGTLYDHTDRVHPQLDYIQGMGFTAIWITPVTEQLSADTGDGEAYHGYWQQKM